MQYIILIALLLLAIIGLSIAWISTALTVTQNHVEE